MYHFIFPSNVLNQKKVDETFQEEADFLRNKGVSFSLFNGEEILFKEDFINKPIHSIYRGWMLSEWEYRNIEKQMSEKNIPLLSGVKSYFNSHYLDLYYNNIKDYTPNTLFSEPEEESLREIYKNKNMKEKIFFIKDSVKSLTSKPNGEASLSRSLEETLDIIEKIKKYKGKIEGKICIREYIKFIDEERRYMVFKGKVFSNSNAQIPNCVYKAALKHKENFFSVDVGIDINGKEWIIEMGDGQVSDFYDKGWSIPEIYSPFI